VRVAFLLKDLQLSGGVHVVVRHATQLQQRHGMSVALVRTAEQDAADWPYPGLDDLRVVHVDDVGGERFDVAISTWWETALDLFRVDAARHVSFVQLFEDSHYAEGFSEQLGFGMTLGLPVRFITEAQWIARRIEALQPGNRVLYVRNGIPKDQFPPVEVVEPSLDRLRIVVEGNPGLVRKGVPHALRAIAGMREPRHVTLVSGERAETPEGVDEHLRALSFDEMAAVFRRSDVLVKLSRAEGMYGPPLEAFHCGCTVVTTPVTGHEEYVSHLENGLVVDWDDPAGTSRALDLLARDRRLLHRLRCGAVATARTWPSWEESSTVFAAALRSIAAAPPPDPAAAGRRLGADLKTMLNELDAERLDRLGSKQRFEALRGQRAVRAALAARDAGRPLLGRARRALRR
jgi:glycosyltransferase involved in cell wall biosynthesis